VHSIGAPQLVSPSGLWASVSERAVCPALGAQLTPTQRAMVAPYDEVRCTLFLWPGAFRLASVVLLLRASQPPTFVFSHTACVAWRELRPPVAVTRWS
jgi:hypothetical protein